jgi:BirA family biotin operon repressor/biotin-[acetyl-CoA-carboxylase] ligase
MTNTDWVLIRLDNTDSTNNYAMQLVNDDKAHNGLTITARSQHSGKGQRGRKWTDAPGKSLLMSIIITPQMPISSQFAFSASIAVAVVNVLQKLLPDCTVHIKWPNDIIVNDKKAGGILIENILRGSLWTHSIVGIGLNILQESFPDNLPAAISLMIACGQPLQVDDIRDQLRSAIVACSARQVKIPVVMEAYNQLLFRRGQQQLFTGNDEAWYATIVQAHEDGTLEVLTNEGHTNFYIHGQVKWVY